MRTFALFTFLVNVFVMVMGTLNSGMMLTQAFTPSTSTTGYARRMGRTRSQFANDIATGPRRDFTSKRATYSKLAALPTCTPNQVIPVALTAGSVALGSQVLLTLILKQVTKRRGSFPFTNKDTTTTKGDLEGFTVHTVVAMGLMLLVSFIGVNGWFFGMPNTPYDRLFAPRPSARWLAAVVAGMFTFWDVPVSLRIRQLRKTDVIVHHVAMAFVAFVGAMWLPMSYLFFYFGVSELSSIPLLVYDQISAMTAATTDEDADSALAKLRDGFRIVAALGFTIVRAFWFTKVTLFNFLPDIASVLRQGSKAVPASSVAALKFGGGMSIAFTCLQLFWFSRMVKVILGFEEE